MSDKPENGLKQRVRPQKADQPDQIHHCIPCGNLDAGNKKTKEKKKFLEKKRQQKICGGGEKQPTSSTNER